MTQGSRGVAGSCTHTRGRSGLAPAVALTLCLAADAAAYQPFPWDEPPGPVEAPPARRAGSPRTPGRGEEVPLGERGPAGSACLVYDWSVRPAGDIGGIGEGSGATVAVPAALPAWLIYGIFVDPGAIFGGITPDAMASGVRGEGLRTSPIIDELTVEVAYSKSTHDDELAGGRVGYERYSLGVRASGPGPADRAFRATATVGWAWHGLDFDSRADLDGTGPYVALGVVLSAPAERSDGGRRYGLALEFRQDWFEGLDGLGGEFHEATATASAGAVVRW